MPRIHVCLLEVSEDELAGGSIVAVRTQKHVREPQLLCHPQEVLRLVVLGAVHDDDCVLPPLRPLLVQPKRQGPEEELHHLGVRVSLRQGGIYVPVGVEPEDHSYPRRNLELGDGIGGARDLPLHPPEVTHSKPGLVDIEEDLFLETLSEELQGPALPEDQVLLRVRVQRYRLDLTKAHSKLLFYHRSDCRVLYWLPTFSVDALCHGLGGVNDCSEVIRDLHNVLNVLALCISLCITGHDFTENLWFSPNPQHKGSNNLR